MYATIVERKLRAVFAALNRGETAPMLDGLAPEFTYRFEGDSPIGGLRTGRATMQLWWERLYRLFPGFAFEVQEVALVGPPWNTRIHVVLGFVVPHAPGGPYRNIVMQFMHMRWGKIDFIHTLEDTQRCERFLAWRAGAGCAEALAQPITDQPWPAAGPFLRA
ncbi:MAG: nuclear transport factor 2 family protein [Pseudomonadota bacterium]